MTKLALVFFLIAVIVILIKEFIRKKDRMLNLSLYQKKMRTMNESEQALFINLHKVLGDEYILLSKVRIEDFVEVNKQKESNHNNRWGLRGRIKSRHVDFLVCDRATTEPLLAIELDGKSHNDPRRQGRDHFVDELYKAINLPIEHVHVGGNFLETAQNIRNVLK